MWKIVNILIWEAMLMKVKELADRLDMKVLAEEGLNNEVQGGYTGDLLSWVM